MHPFAKRRIYFYFNLKKMTKEMKFFDTFLNNCNFSRQILSQKTRNSEYFLFKQINGIKSYYMKTWAKCKYCQMKLFGKKIHHPLKKNNGVIKSYFLCYCCCYNTYHTWMRYSTLFSKRLHFIQHPLTCIFTYLNFLQLSILQK